MSFWSTSTGESAISNNSTSFEIEGGGDILPIPAGTKVLAVIESVKITTVRDGPEKYVEIKWGILKPEVYNKRKVFHKVWCFDLDPMQKDEVKAKAKKDKALKMLAAIDANAGGKLSQAGVEPTGESLSLALIHKPMVVGLNTWDDAATRKPKGNWVYYVGPKDERVTEVTKEDVAKQKDDHAAASSHLSRDMDDSIPF